MGLETSRTRSVNAIPLLQALEEFVSTPYCGTVVQLIPPLMIPGGLKTVVLFRLVFSADLPAHLTDNSHSTSHTTETNGNAEAEFKSVREAAI